MPVDGVADTGPSTIRLQHATHANCDICMPHHSMTHPILHFLLIMLFLSAPRARALQKPITYWSCKVMPACGMHATGYATCSTQHAPWSRMSFTSLSSVASKDVCSKFGAEVDVDADWCISAAKGTCCCPMRCCCCCPMSCCSSTSGLGRGTGR